MQHEAKNAHGRASPETHIFSNQRKMPQGEMLRELQFQSDESDELIDNSNCSRSFSYELNSATSARKSGGLRDLRASSTDKDSLQTEEKLNRARKVEQLRTMLYQSLGVRQKECEEKNEVERRRFSEKQKKMNSYRDRFNQSTSVSQDRDPLRRHQMSYTRTQIRTERSDRGHYAPSRSYGNLESFSFQNKLAAQGIPSQILFSARTPTASTQDNRFKELNGYFESRERKYGETAYHNSNEKALKSQFIVDCGITSGPQTCRVRTQQLTTDFSRLHTRQAYLLPTETDFHPGIIKHTNSQSLTGEEPSLEELYSPVSKMAQPNKLLKEQHYNYRAEQEIQDLAPRSQILSFPTSQTLTLPSEQNRQSQQNARQAHIGIFRSIGSHIEHSTQNKQMISEFLVSPGISNVQQRNVMTRRRQDDDDIFESPLQSARNKQQPSENPLNKLSFLPSSLEKQTSVSPNFFENSYNHRFERKPGSGHFHDFDIGSNRDENQHNREQLNTVKSNLAVNALQQHKENEVENILLESEIQAQTPAELADEQLSKHSDLFSAEKQTEYEDMAGELAKLRELEQTLKQKDFTVLDLKVQVSELQDQLEGFRREKEKPILYSQLVQEEPREKLRALFHAITSATQQINSDRTDSKATLIKIRKIKDDLVKSRLDLQASSETSSEHKKRNESYLSKKKAQHNSTANSTKIESLTATYKYLEHMQNCRQTMLGFHQNLDSLQRELPSGILDGLSLESGVGQRVESKGLQTVLMSSQKAKFLLKAAWLAIFAYRKIKKLPKVSYCNQLERLLELVVKADEKESNLAHRKLSLEVLQLKTESIAEKIKTFNLVTRSHSNTSTASKNTETLNQSKGMYSELIGKAAASRTQQVKGSNECSESAQLAKRAVRALQEIAETSKRIHESNQSVVEELVSSLRGSWDILSIASEVLTAESLKALKGEAKFDPESNKKANNSLILVKNNIKYIEMSFKQLTSDYMSLINHSLRAMEHFQTNTNQKGPSMQPNNEYEIRTRSSVSSKLGHQIQLDEPNCRLTTDTRHLKLQNRLLEAKDVSYSADPYDRLDTNPSTERTENLDITADSFGRYSSIWKNDEVGSESAKNTVVKERWAHSLPGKEGLNFSQGWKPSVSLSLNMQEYSKYSKDQCDSSHSRVTITEDKKN